MADLNDPQVPVGRELGDVLWLSEISNTDGMIRGRPQLTTSEMTAIVEQALVLVSSFYVHLAGKRMLYATDPTQALRNLLNAIADRDDGDDKLTETEFHDRMTTIFVGLRDRHTNYYLPHPFRDTLVFLPFLIEACKDEDRHTQYLVTKVVGTRFEDTEFTAPGYEQAPPVEVTHWNGVPIARAVARSGELSAGANRPARMARGLDRLTYRWLGLSPAPDETWVDLTYRVGGETYHRRFEWLAVRRGAPDESAGVAPPENADASWLGRDQEGEWIRRVKERLFCPADPDEGWDLRSPDGSAAYRTHRRAPGEPPYGYLRIYTFACKRVDSFVAAVRKMLSQAAPAGLIIDIRGNPGGNLVAAERLLSLFSEGPVSQQGLQFLNTPQAIALAGRMYQNEGALMKELLNEARSTGAPFVSSPLPQAPPIRRIYKGLVAVIVDANCYSASEIFAAGMQDHGLATIIGTDRQTGGGGGNVWPDDLIRRKSSPRGLLRRLPQGASFDIAIRRTTRTRARSGVALEDMGVVVLKPNHSPLTVADVLQRNENLLATAITKLEAERAKLEQRAEAEHAAAQEDPAP